MTRNRISKEMIDKKFVGEVDGLSQQLAQSAKQITNLSNTKANKSDIDDFNSRVDEIITTPVDGNVTQQEIIDARQGKGSLGANFTSIKGELQKQKDEFSKNAVRLNNHFNNIEENPPSEVSSRNVTFNNGIARMFYDETRSFGVSRWPNVNWISDNFEIGDKGYVYIPVINHENILWIRLFDNTYDSPYFEPTTAIYPEDTELKYISSVGAYVEDGRTFDFRTTFLEGGFAEYDINNMIVLNLTKIFGAGNEPTKQKMDSLIEQIERVNGTQVLSNQQIVQWKVSELTGKRIETTCYLEISGLDKTTGMITGAPYIAPLNTEQRTGKFLAVLPDTLVKVEVSTGSLFILEYDRSFNFISSSPIVSGIDYKLGETTRFIKVLVEDLTNDYRLECKITHLSINNVANWVKNPRTTEGNLQFLYEVNYPTKGRYMIDTDVNSEYTKEKYYNSGLLKLPRNYDPYGEPTKLIVFCQGSADYPTINVTSFGEDYEDYFDYLADEGYAMLAAYSWTTKYPGFPQMTNPNFGSPITIAALTQAYEWAIENFNIDPNGVYVSGKSAGGYKGLNLAHNKTIPIRAIGMLSPAIFPITHPFGYDPETRRAYAEDFGFEGDHSVLDVDSPIIPFTEDVRTYLRENIPKTIGYNPLWNGIINKSMDELLDLATVAGQAVDPINYEDAVKINTIPTKIWAAEDENLLNTARIYTKTIQNGQGIGELRVMPAGTGGHNAVDSSPDALRVDSITTELGVTHTNVPLAYVELAEFFKRF